MRTLLRIPAAFTILVAFPFATASAGTPATGALAPTSVAAAGPKAEPQIRLGRSASEARPGGAERVHYRVFQRVAPLLAVNADAAPAADALVSTADAVQVAYALEQAGWEELGTLTVEQHLPAPAATPVATASASATATPEAGSAVPRELAISPVGANPASGRSLVVDVALPSAAPARLEMLDVMGRVVAASDLGALGVGRHLVNLSAERRFAPGVYLLRVTQGGTHRVARLTVID
jgi:hypothetical protein